MYSGFTMPPKRLRCPFWCYVLALKRFLDGLWSRDYCSKSLGYWAVTKGLVKPPQDDGTVDVVVDVPSGRVVASVAVKRGRAVHVDLANVTSYQLAESLLAAVPSCGFEVNVDLACGGAGLKVEPGNVDDFIRIAREIKASLGKRAHYGSYDCYGVIFFDEEEVDADGTVRQRKVTVFADGQIDRSPCGSGTSARLVVLFA
ncbi:hypothetical protein F5B19DRAFT_58599 [Rostrohypoxylon terebratum]|nr:hypothetical protein F5B19DRAFT_58599 [Rostrohypoxylon terebratum]